MLWGEGLFWCHKWVSTHFSKKHGERVGVRWKKRNKKTQKNRALCHGWSSSRNPLPINPSSQFTPPCQERHQSPLGAALLGGNTKQSVNDLSAHMQVDRARDHLGYRPTSSISDTNTTLPTCSTHSKCVCHQSSGLKQQTQGLCGEGTTRYSGFGGFLPRCVGWVVSDLPVITEKKRTQCTPAKRNIYSNSLIAGQDMMKTCRNKHVRSTGSLHTQLPTTSWWILTGAHPQDEAAAHPKTLEHNTSIFHIITLKCTTAPWAALDCAGCTYGRCVTCSCTHIRTRTHWTNGHPIPAAAQRARVPSKPDPRAIPFV